MYLKELQHCNELNWYDYGARYYDLQIGRWWSVDPLAEQYLSFSTYHYTKNNPVRYYDILGMSAADDIWKQMADSSQAEYLGSAQWHRKKEEEEKKKQETYSANQAEKDKIPFGGIMFYNENGDLIYASKQGTENIIYTVNQENVDDLNKKIHAYISYWSQKRPCIDCGNMYNDPNYFQKLAIKYGKNSYSVIASYDKNNNPYIYGSRKARWYTYLAATITISGEGFIYGKYRIAPSYRNYSVANTWQKYLGLKKFNPWW